MRTLVIGGTLFIGRAIVERLAASGHDVTVLHRGDRHDLGPHVRNARADRADIASVSRVLRDGRFEAVFDIAYDWQRGTTPEQVEQAARACGSELRRYVFMSSVAAYKPGVDLTESAPLVDGNDPNPYARQKASGERALFRMHRESEFPVVTFRPPFVYGPRQPFYREQFFWDRMLDGRPIVLPDGGGAPMQWVFVSDLAGACVRALDVAEAAGQAFNFAHGERLTQRTYVEALARAAGVAPSLVPVPRAAIRAAGGQLLGDNIYFGEYLDIGAYSTVTENARRVLGVTPTPLDVAIEEAFAWYRSQPRRKVDYTFEDGLLAMGS